MKILSGNNITRVIPIFIVFVIVAFLLGHGIDLLTQGLFNWIMTIGIIVILSSITTFFTASDSLVNIWNNFLRGLLILIIGGGLKVAFDPDPNSYTEAEVTEQMLHRTDFSKSMTIRLQHELKYRTKIEKELYGEDYTNYSREFRESMEKYKNVKE